MAEAIVLTFVEAVPIHITSSRCGGIVPWKCFSTTLTRLNEYIFYSLVCFHLCYECMAGLNIIRR